MNSSKRPERTRGSLQWQIVGAALLLAGCTAPPPGHPYWPLAKGNTWSYEGHQTSPTNGPSSRSERFTVKALTTEAQRTRADVEAWSLGWMGAQGADDEQWILSAAGLLPMGPADGERVGVELPIDLATAAPWEHAIHRKVGGTRHSEIARSEVVGRRRIKVLADTFDHSVVVRTEHRFETQDGDNAPTVESFVTLRDFVCGVGMVRRVMQDGLGHGHELRLHELQVDPDGRRGCDIERAAQLPVYGEAALAAAATRRCDVAMLEVIGAELEETQRGALRATVPARLLAACADAMPPSVLSYLETGRDPLPYTKEPEVEAWIDRACPGIDTQRFTDSGWGQALEPEGIFASCGLARLGMRRDELEGTLANNQTFTLLPWGLHQWFIEQGVSPSSASSIAKALLARERRTHSWVPTEIQLPWADGDDAFRGVPLEISRSQIRFQNNDVIVTLSAGLRVSTTPYEMVDDPLFAALLDAAVLAPYGWADGEPEANPLLIAADAATPMATIVDLLALAKHTGFTRQKLVVERDDGRVRAIEVACEAVTDRPGVEPDLSPVMTVELTAAQASLGAGHPGVTLINGNDHAALRAYAVAFKQQHADAHRIVISAAGDVTLGAFVAVIATIRGPGCDIAHDCVLPDVLVSKTPAHRFGLQELERAAVKRMTKRRR